MYNFDKNKKGSHKRESDSLTPISEDTNPKLNIEVEIEEWEQVSQHLKQLKKKELNLRICISEATCGELKTGIHCFHTEEKKVIISKRTTTSVIRESLMEHWGLLSSKEKECFSFFPKLSMDEYNKLEDTSTIDKFLICKPSAPTIKIKEDIENED